MFSGDFSDVTKQNQISINLGRKQKKKGKKRKGNLYFNH